MRQRKWLRLIIVFVLTTLLLNACSFSVQVFPTPTSSPQGSTVTSASSTATQTPVPPTAILASATPTLITITAGMIGGLEIFSSVGEGELLRSVAFTPDNTVLASAGGNNEDFAIRLWDVMSGESSARWIGTQASSGQ